MAINIVFSEKPKNPNGKETITVEVNGRYFVKFCERIYKGEKYWICFEVSVKNGEIEIQEEFDEKNTHALREYEVNGEKFLEYAGGVELADKILIEGEKVKEEIDPEDLNAKIELNGKEYYKIGKLVRDDAIYWICQAVDGLTAMFLFAYEDEIEKLKSRRGEDPEIDKLIDELENLEPEMDRLHVIKYVNKDGERHFEYIDDPKLSKEILDSDWRLFSIDPTALCDEDCEEVETEDSGRQ